MEDVLKNIRGSKWLCKKSGEIFTVPEDCRLRDFYTWGEDCFIDVGDGYYFRFGGDVEKVE